MAGTYFFARARVEFGPFDAQLRAAGCTKICAEKVSGARSDRPELVELLKRPDQVDVLIVTRLGANGWRGRS